MGPDTRSGRPGEERPTSTNNNLAENSNTEKKSTTVKPEIVPTTAEEWAARIEPHLHATVNAIIATGNELIAAKAALVHGEFGRCCEMVGLTSRTAQRFMSIASNPVTANATHASHLPPAWTTLFELSRADPDVLAAAITDGEVTPETTRKEAIKLAKLPVDEGVEKAPVVTRAKRSPLSRSNVVLTIPKSRDVTRRAGDYADAISQLAQAMITWNVTGADHDALFYLFDVIRSLRGQTAAVETATRAAFATESDVFTDEEAQEESDKWCRQFIAHIRSIIDMNPYTLFHLLDAERSANRRRELVDIYDELGLIISMLKRQENQSGSA